MVLEAAGSRWSGVLGGETVDAPFLRPSNVPSSITLGPRTLTLPTRSASTVEVEGERTNPPDTAPTG